MRERALPYLFVGLLLLALPAALASQQIAIALGLAAIGVLLLALIGLERAANFTLVAAFFSVPWDRMVVPGVSFLTPSDALFLLAVVLALPRLLTHRLWVPPAFLIGSLVFTVLAVLSCLNSTNAAQSSYYAARVVIMLIVIPALLVWGAPRGKMLIALALAFAAGTSISIVWGVFASVGVCNYGLTQHANVLGATATLAMALLPFLPRALPRQHRTWIGLSVLGVAGVGIMTSGSRAALIVAVVLLVLYPAAERSIVAALAVLGSGVVAIVLVGQRVAASNSEDALSRLLGSGTATVANQARVEGVEKVWALAVQHPYFGSGFNFSDFLGHNAYVQIAASAGFIGLAAFVFVLLSMVAPLFLHDDIHSRLVYPAVVFIIAAPVSPQLTDRYIGFLLGLSLVGVVAVHEAAWRRQRDDGEADSGPVLRDAAAVHPAVRLERR
jgi:hypothetical protein